MRDAGQEFVESMGRHLEEEGAARIAGRLFGFLMLQEEPRSLDELAEALRVSKGSVSSNARLLEQWGVAERITEPGDRRDFYALAPDMHARILERQVARIGTLIERMRHGRESLGPVSDVVDDRFRRSVRFHEEVLGILGEALERVRAGLEPR